MVEVIFYKGKDPLSRFIKWWTGGVFSHCGFRFFRCLVVDIDLIHGVRARFDPWNPWDVETIEIEVDCISLLNSLYMSRWTDYSLIEGLRSKLPFFPDDPHKWHCAEMVNDLYLGRTTTLRNPDDLYYILKR